MSARKIALEYLTRPRTMSQYASLDDLYAAETSERLSVVAALERELAQPVEPVAEIIKFRDTSTASAIEKTRRYLTTMADKRQGNSYFYDDGYPRVVIADDAAAALAVFEQLAAPQEPAVNAELLAALQYAIKQVPELATVPGIALAIKKATGGAA